MQNKRGKGKYIVLALGNMVIVACILILYASYAKDVRGDNAAAARESFTAAVESTAQLSYGYMSSLQNECDSWASYLENHDYSMKEAIEYLNEVNINADFSVNILYYDTLTGLSTNPENEGDKVDYSQLTEAFSYILPKMVNGTRGEGTIYISSTYVNPLDRVKSVGFCSLLTIKDENEKPAKAILVKTVPVEVLGSQWIFPGAYREAEVSLIDINGRYIIQSASMGSDTFWSFIKKYNDLSYIDIGDFQSSFQKKDHCLVELADQAGKAAYYVSAQIKNTPNCTFVGYISADKVIAAESGWHVFFYASIGFILLLLLDGSYILSINRQLRKSVEETRNANLAKTQFLSAMSHDIRTPMNAIIGITEIAMKDTDNSVRVLDCLKKIALSSSHLLTLVNDVLDISQVESGKLILHPVVFSLSECSMNLLNIVKSEIKDKRLAFNVYLHHLEHEYLYADELRMNQIFINLLTNAVKYTDPDGKVVLDFLETQLPDNCGKVMLTYTVLDTGIGMSREFMKNMYQTFTRAADSRIDKVIGSGLGLAITKQMVDLMDGTIECESELGKGTKFTVTLPLQTAEKTNDYMLPPLRILLVDEDDIFLDTTAATLVSMGATVDKANQGHTAIKMAAAKHYPIIIVSFHMLEIDYIQTIRALQPGTGDEATVLLISAYDWDGMEDTAKAAGADGFISKLMFRSVIYKKFNQFLHPREIEIEVSDDTADDLQGLHLLVAEDNDLNWEIIEELLKFYEIDATRAENGQVCVDTLNRAETGTYDAVLMDIQMPVMNGREASMGIRSLQDKEKQNIPIIAMTADAFAEDIRACLEAGMNGHVAKPIDMKRLFRELRNVGLANERGRR
ncbi:response regulator [Ruminococcus sp. OA3]|uniref:hybrid sensor histidine kinase/response regulator n=1 Tax=Ruminococcus sp. OA3 TaxID=2914164 RepID=UPI001F0706A3|nr:response regulator [Ruminococcus sp. OA3]MCH1983010.1 response regulator [Ruminococcus sp. OA3]